jgi:hypothetical protein
VGEDTKTPPQTFSVHADLLASRSAFFAKALRNYTKMYRGEGKEEAMHNVEQQIQWREGEEGVVELPVDQPEVFANYVQLLYSGALPIFDKPERPKMDPKTMTREEVKNMDADFEQLIVGAVDRMYLMLGELYVFCERIRDIAAKHNLLVAFIKESSRSRANGSTYYPDQLVVEHVYPNTLPSDPLREFLVDCYVYVGHSKWISGGYKDFPAEFLFDFMVSIYQVRARPEDRSRLKDTDYYLEKLNAPESREKEEDTEMQVDVE